MKIDILCSDPNHPVNASLSKWRKVHNDHTISILRDVSDLAEGDLLFLVSCSQIISSDQRGEYAHTLVLHASDLPNGRGWSPHIWTILAGVAEITVSLLCAEDDVDTGDIWAQQTFHVDKGALYDEINDALFKAELLLMDRAIDMILSGGKPQPQSQDGVSYWPKRRSEDGELDPKRSITDLFNEIRVADPDRYPAFFKLHNQIYTITLQKVTKDD